MLKDRIVLVELEIDKLMAECSKIYQSIAIHGDVEDSSLYENKLKHLFDLVNERLVIKSLIAKGSE